LKITLYLTLLIVLVPMLYAVENCEKIIEPQDIPCRIVSAWNYTIPCNSHTAKVYNNSGINVINYTFQDYGNSLLCYFLFNYTTRGSYNIITDVDDNGEIIVRYINMQLGIIIGIGIVMALFLFLAFKLDASHGILRLVLIFFSIALLPIIPAVYIIDDFALIFNKILMGFIVVFWLYVAGYIFYWIYQKMMNIISTKKE